MQVYETVAGAPWEASELRVYRVPTVDASGMHRAGVHTGAQLGRHVRGLVRVSLLGHSSPVLSVQIHPGLGAAASLDRDGGLVVWLADPLTPVFALPGGGSGSTATPFTTAAWVPTPPAFLPALPSMMGDHPQALLAAAAGSNLLLSAVCLSPHSPTATRVAELSVPPAAGRLLALCVKQNPGQQQPAGSPLTRYLLGCASSGPAGLGEAGHSWLLWQLDVSARPAGPAGAPDSPGTPRSAAAAITVAASFLGQRPAGLAHPPILSVAALVDAGADMATCHADGGIVLWRCRLPPSEQADGSPTGWSLEVAAAVSLPFEALPWATPLPGAAITSVACFAALAVSAGGGRIAVALRSTGYDEGAVVIWQVRPASAPTAPLPYCPYSSKSASTDSGV